MIAVGDVVEMRTDQPVDDLDDLDELAIKGLAGRLTSEEEARLDALCAGSPEALERVRSLSDVWMLGAVARGEYKHSSGLTSMKPRDRRWVIAVAAVLVVTLGASLWFAQSARTITYDAPADAVRMVQLSDGTRLTLSRGGRIEVSIDDEHRDIRQLAGEAYYDVAHDPARPLVVRSGGHRLTVLGTRFNVSPDVAGLQVDLLEGRLRVESERGASAIVLTSGQTFRQNRTPAVVISDVESAVDWATGRLIFDDVTLTEVASRIRRHTGRTMSFTSPEAASLRFSGVLAVDRPGEWAVALETVLPVDARGVDGGMEITLKDG